MLCISILRKEVNQLNSIKNFFIDLPKPHKVIISAFSVFFMILLFIPSETATAGRQSQEMSLEIGKRYQIKIPTAETVSNTEISEESPDPENTVIKSLENFTWDTAKVKSGDSLAKILRRLGYSAKTTYNITQAKGTDTKLLQTLRIGDILHISKNSEGKLISITYPLSKTDTLFIDWKNDHYQSHKESKTVEIREATAHGIINSNFWNAGIEAGLGDKQIINLATIFGWDIDFALDIRKGDSFHVVFEEQYIDGEFIGTGNILAAEFVNQNDPFQAIRFTDGEFYSATGKSMRKAFLRAPVNFRYISSNFKRKRFHPIQKRWKAHNGTDYRAKTGTPVVAAGNGTVTSSAYNKYNGNYVFIQHGNGIVTKYLHFSKRKVKKGQRVKQGDVIGYVGSTGMSEASHLHFEFLLNGVHRNPRTVKLPDANPIKKQHKAEFQALATKRLSEISGSKQAMLSMLEKTAKS